MLEAKVVDTIRADVEAVWAELGNFSGIKAGPGIDSVDYEGEGEGMTRSINMSNGASSSGWMFMILLRRRSPTQLSTRIRLCLLRVTRPQCL